MKRASIIFIYSIGAVSLLCAIIVIWITFTWPPFSDESKLVEHIRVGNYVAVKELVDSGVDINKPAKWRGMMSTSSWTDGRTALTKAAEANQRKIAKLLLSKGADINAYDGFGQTPVHVSSQHGHYEITKLFIMKKCNLNHIPSTNNFNALANAAILAKDEELVRLILENGAILTGPEYVKEDIVKFINDTQDKSLINLLKKR